jgi:hypothetical protein
LKTDDSPTSSNENESKGMQDMQWENTPMTPLRRSNPHWLENVNVTNEFIYRYQVNARTLSDVLNDDLYALKNIHQVIFKNP